MTSSLDMDSAEQPECDVVCENCWHCSGSEWQI